MPNPWDEDIEDTGSEGQGGQSGSQEFKDFLNSAPQKPSAEMVRALIGTHEARQGFLQEKLRDYQNNLNRNLSQQQGLSQGRGQAQQQGAEFKSHRILKDKAYFQGRSDQNLSVDTNYKDPREPNANKKELILQKQNRLEKQPELAQRYTHKPSPFGG